MRKAVATVVVVGMMTGLTMTAEAGSAVNTFVQVSCGNNTITVNVDANNKSDFHIFAPGYRENDTAFVQVSPASPEWQLVKPTSGVQMKGGDKCDYEVKGYLDSEGTGAGKIYFHNYFIASSEDGGAKNITVPPKKQVTYTAYRDKDASGNKAERPSNWTVNGETKISAAKIVFNRSAWDVPAWYIPTMNTPKPGAYNIKARDWVVPALLHDEGRMTVIGAELNLLWETGNKANQIFNPTPKDDPPAIPTNVLYVVASPVDGKYRVTLDVTVKATLALAEGKVLYAVFTDCGHGIKLTEGKIPISGLVTIAFSHPQGISGIHDFGIMVGYDADGTGKLDWSGNIPIPLEVVNPQNGARIGDAIVRGASLSQYAAAQNSINAVFGGSWLWGFLSNVKVPTAKSLLYLFWNGSPVGMPDPTYAPISSVDIGFNAFYPGYFSEWLTHNSGAAFNDIGETTLQEYQWDTTTPLANLIASAPQIENALGTFYYKTIYPQVINYFANQPFGTEAYFPPSTAGEDIPHKSESQPWVPGCTLKLNTWWPDMLGDDTNASVGRGRLLSHKARYRVKKENIAGVLVAFTVTEVKSWGEMIDLYDFNWDVSGDAHNAAVLQVGYGNGSYGPDRNRGRIFRTRVQFSKTYGGLP
ncbi:MAG: hypothetical protein FWH21_01220 [Kiritimatiellaeota bacterium]|nr:hypothetical protein [Kiritimatiellota bacterium]